ncbi:hypothetical protein BJ165DRAFT_1614561 [Panaeolus papilionaceus]|nr:hypothetical protein BJ165DRAFT_1614561 [Panaeolus papilionaceus]
MRQSEIQIELCDSLSAPIRCLPLDTLREIFSWCIQTRARSPHRELRSEALRTPSSIVQNIDDPDSQPSPFPLQNLQKLTIIPRLASLYLFHNVVKNSKLQSDDAEQYASLFDSRSQWRNQRSLVPKFSLHISVSSYQKQGSKKQVEREAPEREFKEFKAAVYHDASGRAYKGSAGSLVIVEKAREPFQKIQQTSLWRDGETPASQWETSIDASFPEPL